MGVSRDRYLRVSGLPHLTRLMHSARGPLAPKEKHALAAVCTGTVYTGHRVAKWGGPGARGDTCSLCQGAADTLIHRLLRCPAPAVSVWPCVPEWLRAAIRSAAPDEAPLALTRLWWAPPTEAIERCQLGPRREDTFALRYVSSFGDA